MMQSLKTLHSWGRSGTRLKPMKQFLMLALLIVMTVKVAPVLNMALYYGHYLDLGTIKEITHVQLSLMVMVTKTKMNAV